MVPNQGRHRRRPGRRPSRVMGAVLGFAAIIGAGLSWQAASAAFSGNTSGSNAFTVGSVDLSDDTSGTVLFNATGLGWTSAGSACLNVTYTGGIPANIRFYGAATGTLTAYLVLNVERGTGATGGSGGSCTGFSSSASVFGGTASTLPATFAAATATNRAVSATTTDSYRISYSLQNDSNAANTTATVVFTWEVQSA